MKTALHSFEMVGEKSGGFLGFGGTKPTFYMYNDGFGWTEGKDLKFVPYTGVKQLKYSKYYSTVSVIHSETKKIALLNVQIFEAIWTSFASKNTFSFKLTAE